MHPFACLERINFCNPQSNSKKGTFQFARKQCLAKADCKKCDWARAKCVLRGRWVIIFAKLELWGVVVKGE